MVWDGVDGVDGGVNEWLIMQLCGLKLSALVLQLVVMASGERGRAGTHRQLGTLASPAVVNNSSLDDDDDDDHDIRPIIASLHVVVVIIPTTRTAVASPKTHTNPPDGQQQHVQYVGRTRAAGRCRVAKA